MTDIPDVHSVTCPICGEIADSRVSANITEDIEVLGPSMRVESPLLFGAIQQAVVDFGEGEAHQECFGEYFDEYAKEHIFGYLDNLADEPLYTVDGRFTHEGVSVSVYEDGGERVFDESWFTWDEVEERKGNGSDFTFEIGGGS